MNSVLIVSNKPDCINLFQILFSLYVDHNARWSAESLRDVGEQEIKDLP